jgi:UDP-N-acetylmuramate dehydrogenase
VTEKKLILEDSYRGRLKFDEPLGQYTVIGVGGLAQFFLEATSEEDLIEATTLARQDKMSFFILGGGSAVLFSDARIEGLVIRNLFEGIKESLTDSPSRVAVEVGSGTSLAKLVRYTVDHGFSGLEGLAGKMGTVGGAIVTNTYGLDTSISDYLISVKAIDTTGQVRILAKGDCLFEEGKSRFKDRAEVVLSATFHLRSSEVATVTENVSRVIARNSNQPKIPRTLELFYSIDGQSPDRLIAAVGLAGAKIGGAVVLSDHPNFIQNLGQATAENIAELIKLIKIKVGEKYYTELAESFTYVGPF